MGQAQATVRQYPQSYRMVWVAVLLMLLILVAEHTGLLYGVMEKQQQHLLAGDTEPLLMITGTVIESKHGQGYFFLQAETGERFYVTMPYESYDTTLAMHTVWYPVGTTLRVEGIATLPDKARNPGGFDEAAWLFSKKTGIILSAHKIDVLSGPQGIFRLVYQMQSGIEQILYQALSKEQADLSMALLTGAKHRLADDFYAMTQYMGIAHIFAVSGLHVGLIGSVVLWGFYQMGWQRSWVATGLLAIGLGSYCMLAGLPASAIRATIMILISVLAMMLYRPPNGINFLAFAAVVLLLDNPLLLWNAGFQLSFGVTLALLVFVTPIQNKLWWISNKTIRSSMAVVLAAYLGSVPLTAWHFYTFSIWSPVFNLMLVPLVTMAVPLLFLALVLSVWLPVGIDLYFLPAKLVLWLLQEGAILLYEATAGAQWNIGRPDGVVMMVYGVFLVVLWHWLQNRRLFASIGCQGRIVWILLALVVVGSMPSAPHRDELLYLDIGQGSSALLRTKQGEVVLFDTGAQTQELASVLAWYGVNHVEGVILSHGDLDHVNGLNRVLDTVAVAHIFVEKESIQRDSLQALFRKAEEKGTRLQGIEKATSINLINHRIVLEPIRNDTDMDNGTQLTAMLHYSNGAVAFPGDLSLEEVVSFVKKQNGITLWTVPHHGSRYAGSAALYRQLMQKGVQYAVISSGKNNRYGHPHREVLQWIDDCGIVRYGTAEHGAILFVLSDAS